MARPKKPDQERYSVLVQLRLRPKEKARLVELANRREVCQSVLLRSLILKAYREEVSNVG